SLTVVDRQWRQPLSSVRRRDVMPGRPVPNDPFTAWKQQLHGAGLRPGAPHLLDTLQMLSLPAVAQREPDTVGTETILLQGDRVFKHFVHDTHVRIPPPCSSGCGYRTSSAMVSSGSRPCARYCPIFSINGASDTAYSTASLWR